MKKAALTALQVIVTLGILFLVFRDPAKRAEMGHALARANQFWLLAGIALYGLVELIVGIRWQLLLRVQGISLSWARVCRLTLVGVFFNYFIPGGTGGDVVKIFYLLKETPGKRTAALLSVLVDRIVGLLGLVILTALLIAVRWSWLMSTPATSRYVWPALAILVFGMGGLHFSWFVTRHSLVHRLPARLPGRDKLAEMALAFTLYGRAWRPTLISIGLSVLAHIVYFAVFYCAAESLRGSGVKLPSYLDLSAIMPIVNTLASMPISVGGLGVREGLFQVFLSNLCGVSEAVAVLISSTGYLLTFFWGLVGGGFYLFYRPSEHARLRDIKTEVAAFEHTVAEEEVAMEIAEEEKL